jgi:hypothetical protein
MARRLLKWLADNKTPIRANESLPRLESPRNANTRRPIDRSIFSGGPSAQQRPPTCLGGRLWPAGELGECKRGTGLESENNTRRPVVSYVAGRPQMQSVCQPGLRRRMESAG